MSSLLKFINIRGVEIMFLPLTFMVGMSWVDYDMYYEAIEEEVGGLISIYLGIFCFRIIIGKKEVDS